MANNGPPWNKGLTGLEAGWDDERRKQASDNQKKRIKQDPDKFYVMFRSGSQPHTWIAGPKPSIHRHYYRFLRARNQARFWSQKWSITWKQYLALYENMSGNWSRSKRHKNLCRIDTSKGWTLKNVQLISRMKAMRRPTKGRHRIRPEGLGSKAKGITWKRGGGPKDD